MNARYSVVRDADWLTPPRVVAVARCMLFVFLVIAATLYWTAPNLQVDRDFSSFWTAGRLGVSGHAADAYSEPERQAIATLFGPANYTAFSYPPTAILLFLPFALLPFIGAAALWFIVTASAYLVGICAIAGRKAVPFALAFPAVFICGLYGQNSLLSAALFAGSAITMEESPWVAGVLLGCLSYKPQWACLVPLGLVAASRWRTFAATGITTIALTVLSVYVFDMQSWKAFFAVLPEYQAWNSAGVPGFDKFVSLYASARLLGMSATTAWNLQIGAAVTAAAVLWTLVRRRPGGGAEIALLVAMTGFCIPFAGEYDLAMFAVPGAWLVAEACRYGWLPYERLLSAMLFLSPAAIKWFALAEDVPLGPVAILLLAVLIVRRIIVCVPNGSTETVLPSAAQALSCEGEG